MLALQMKPIIEARAKENLSAGAAMTNTGLQISVKAVNTQEELAKLAGVSHDTIAKIEKIEREAPEPTNNIPDGKTTRQQRHTSKETSGQ